jgi:uncharacterized membrane protein
MSEDRASTRAAPGSPPRTNRFDSWTRVIRGRLASLSMAGLNVGLVFVAFSLTPTLVPRPFVFQGVVSGVSLALGYSLGTGGRWLWSYLGIPLPGPRVQRALTRAATAVCLTVAVTFLWEALEWQNSVRRLMGMQEESNIRPLGVGVIASLIFWGLLSLARWFRKTFAVVSAWLRPFLPRRVANLVGVAIAVTLFWTVINGVLFEVILRIADNISEQVDATVPADFERPQNPARTGSAQSLVPWQDLGYQGRQFVSSGPTSEELAAFLAEPAPAPIRVYVGLNAAETAEGRAGLAVRELERAGGFAKSVLFVVTPTGTGWVDPAAMNTVEYLLRGNVASVAMQYSYLPSVLALPTEGAHGVENARALFKAVHDRWSTLPRETRPTLYLYGLSLGALNSQRSFDFHDILAEPFQGALWTGPPFPSELWQSLTAGRHPDSPVWLPRFRHGAVVRFMNQHGGLEVGDAVWGPVRIAYLQHASDPMTFFSVQSLYREPDWMREPRGPDVSRQLRWFPLVTMVQLAADMGVANTTPPGYGHNFAAEDYIDAWLALLEPVDWSDADIRRLKALHETSR